MCVTLQRAAREGSGKCYQNIANIANPVDASRESCRQRANFDCIPSASVESQLLLDNKGDPERRRLRRRRTPCPRRVARFEMAMSSSFGGVTRRGRREGERRQAGREGVNGLLCYKRGRRGGWIANDGKSVSSCVEALLSTLETGYKNTFYPRGKWSFIRFYLTCNPYSGQIA